MILVNDLNTASLNAALHNLPDVNVDTEQIEAMKNLTLQFEDQIKDGVEKLNKLREEFDVLYPVCKEKLQSRIH